MKLEIKYTKKIKRFTNTWGLNKMLNNHQQVMEEIREIKKSSSQKWKYNILKFVGSSKSSSIRDSYRDKCLPQEI